MIILHIYEPKAIFLLFFDYKTLSMSNEKYKILYLDQYLPRNVYKGIYVTRIYIVYNMGERNETILYICGYGAIFLLFCNSKILNMSN